MQPTTIDDAIAEALITAARDARDSDQSYAPISNYNVGAAVRTPDGTIFTGGNIENDNFTNTIHAEEAAFTGAAKAGYRDITHIAVATSGSADDVPPEARTSPSPCGHCKQTLSQFMDEDIPLIADKGDGEYEVRMLPIQFQLPDDYDDE